MDEGSSRVGRRRLLKGLAQMGGLGIVGRFGFPLAAQLYVDAARAQDGSADSSGTRLILLGTQGGPNFNATRSEAASALVIDGKTYLVDCGYGALGALRKAGLSFRDVGNVFLTHLHDDHVGDVAALLSHQWTDGRTDATLVMGPYGTKNLVEASLAFAAANAAIRLVDEDRSVKPVDVFRGQDIQATQTPVEIYADDRVSASSIENTHFPESTKRKIPYRSLSYRFDSDTRSVTFSGDTAYSEGLVRLARDADVLVCETIEVASMRQAFERKVANGSYADNAEGVWNHIVGTHTSTEDAGRMAAEAGVKTLVLNHLLPGALLPVGDETYLAGVRKHFAGEVIVGKDLMTL